MSEFFEIDFLEAGENKSGDAMALRYTDTADLQYIHVVDGGYSNDGQALTDHIRKYYNGPEYIDHVVLTHPDGDHAAGLETILQEFEIGALWMNRPWEHVDDLLPEFEYDYTRSGLIARLKKDFPYTAKLEKIAIENDISIYDAFQGGNIGAFTVLAPSYDRYLELIVDSEKTPEPEREATIADRVYEAAKAFLRSVAAIWGAENLKGDTEGTSCENEASIVQYAELCGEKILLTGDAGVGALEEAYDHAIASGINLPGLDRFQVPHHGSRRNLSSEILDKWFGETLPEQLEKGNFSAIVSANRNDDDHPRKAVVRALIHRGGNVVTTKGRTVCTSRNAPDRAGWISLTPLEYPEDQEE